MRRGKGEGGKGGERKEFEGKGKKREGGAEQQ